jgi:hypothetical protein
MDPDAMARADRRRQRASQWPVRRFDLGKEPLRDALDQSTVDERLALMWPLAKEAWSVAGMPIANYERRNMPGKLVRRERNLGPVKVRFIGKAAMARNKLAAGRPKDLVDAELLQSDE